MQYSRAGETVIGAVHVNTLLVLPSENLVHGPHSIVALVPTAKVVPRAGLDDAICPALSVWESGIIHTENIML